MIGVILFDIVTGIIIDTFGSMREAAADRRETVRSSTFIAGIDRGTIESSSLSFNEINEVDQNKWNYVYLMVHLHQKDSAAFSGAESFINDCIKEGDPTWLPQGLCWALQQKDIATEVEDPKADQLKIKAEIIERTDESVARSTEAIKADMREAMDAFKEEMEKNVRDILTTTAAAAAAAADP